MKSLFLLVKSGVSPNKNPSELPNEVRYPAFPRRARRDGHGLLALDVEPGEMDEMDEMDGNILGVFEWFGMGMNGIT